MDIFPQDFEDSNDALREFEFLYEEKTGNRWRNRNEFKKVSANINYFIFHLFPLIFVVQVPGRMYPLEIDMGETVETKLSLENSKSNLPRPVQELITLIFDIGRIYKRNI